MRALILSLSTARAAQVAADVDRLLADGYSIEVVTTKAQDFEHLPPEVEVHQLTDAERGHPLLRAERFLVLVLPRWVYTAVARVLRLAARLLLGRLGRRVDRLGGVWKRRWIATREATRRFHKERWGRWYSYVRPWFLWRVARRKVLPRLNSSWDVIVVADALSTPIGWKLARRHPTASVGFSLEEALDAGADRHG